MIRRADSDASRLVRITRRLAREVGQLSFGPPVTHVYNPLQYAWHPHRTYLQRFGGGNREVVLVGMNPGPFGMAQTGVPFGEVEIVREWLEIEGKVDKPPDEHPKRPVVGFGCRRREVSGRRLWGWARDRFGTPSRFFQRFFVYNYCPLVFIESTGRNRTPDKLPAREREPLFALCDAALRRVVATLEPRVAVGVGRFAEGRLRIALAGLDVVLGHLPHPSPASPSANRGWARQADRALQKLALL